MKIKHPLVNTIPHPRIVCDLLGNALREVELLKKLLIIAERAEKFRQCDRERAATGSRGRKR